MFEIMLSKIKIMWTASLCEQDAVCHKQGLGIPLDLEGEGSIFSLKQRITFQNFYVGKTDTISGNVRVKRSVLI